MMRRARKVRVGITMGDPAGAGPQAIALSLKRLYGKAHFTIIGDERIFEKAKKKAGSAAGTGAYDFVDLKNVAQKTFRFGRPTFECGRAAVDYIDYALGMLKEGRIDCLVTGPVSKEMICRAGIPFSGHTEYLAGACGVKDYAMMLLNKKLKITLATRHLPLVKAAGTLSSRHIRTAALLTHQWLRVFFGISNPRLVICGVNPHASDNGLLGTQENAFIKPLIRRLKAKGMAISGPYAAEAALLKTAEGFYDAAVAMYHDQAMIALKLSDASSGVNLTLGLPFVRTSPLHGTAFDAAARGEVSGSSFTRAITTAIDCCLRFDLRHCADA